MLSGSDELSSATNTKTEEIAAATTEHEHSSSICMATQHHSPETELEQAYSVDTLADEDDEIIFLWSACHINV